MFPGSTNGGGQCAAIAPDVCDTPNPGGVTSIPYPNLGMPAQAVNFSTKVKFCGAAVLNVMSEIPMSSGDEAGVAGGVVSGQNMGKVRYAMGSIKVLIEGKGCEYQSAPTLHNGDSSNTGGIQAAPSQVKVLVGP